MDETNPPATVSPAIVEISWGRMVIQHLGDGLDEGLSAGLSDGFRDGLSDGLSERLSEGKDFKLYPGGGRAWDWSETGTRHSPGIQPADVAELLEHGATVVVLSRGMDEQLDVAPETLELLAARGIETHVAETRAAVALYNELARTRPVGGLFHSTC